MSRTNAVDFKLVQGQPLQIRQGGIPGPEIIQRKLHAVPLQARHDFDRLLEIVHKHALRDFQLQFPGIGARLLQRRQHLLNKICLAELPRAHIDRHRQL